MVNSIAESNVEASIKNIILKNKNCNCILIISQYLQYYQSNIAYGEKAAIWYGRRAGNTEYRNHKCNTEMQI